MHIFFYEFIRGFIEENGITLNRCFKKYIHTCVLKIKHQSSVVIKQKKYSLIRHRL